MADLKYFGVLLFAAVYLGGKSYMLSALLFP